MIPSRSLSRLPAGFSPVSLENQITWLFTKTPRAKDTLFRLCTKIFLLLSDVLLNSRRPTVLSHSVPTGRISTVASRCITASCLPSSEKSMRPVSGHGGSSTVFLPDSQGSPSGGPFLLPIYSGCASCTTPFSEIPCSHYKCFGTPAHSLYRAWRIFTCALSLI